MSVKERAPARTTPPKRFHCKDCNSNFRARYLANRNTCSTQHWCLVYGKVVTRKVGQKSQKCQCDHEGPCLTERDGPSRPGYESEDEAKAKQRQNKGNPPPPSDGRPKKTSNAGATRKGSNNSNNSNKKSSKSSIKSNKLSNGSNSTNSENKAFEKYLYSHTKSKKRFSRENDDSEDDWDNSYLPDKKRRRKNKNKTSSSSSQQHESSPYSKADITSLSNTSHVPMPDNSDEDEDDDIYGKTDTFLSHNASHHPMHASASFGSQAGGPIAPNGTNGMNGANGQFADYYETTQKRAAVRVMPGRGAAAFVAAAPVAPVLPVGPVAPPVLSMEGEADGADSENEANDGMAEYENKHDNNDKNGRQNGRQNGTQNGVETNGNDRNEAIFKEFVEIYNKATQCMADALYDEALQVLEGPLANEKYLIGLSDHPILSESHLIVAHALQALERIEQALRSLERIKNCNRLPLPLQLRIKDTEVQLHKWCQNYDNARRAQNELDHLKHQADQQARMAQQQQQHQAFV